MHHLSLGVQQQRGEKKKNNNSNKMMKKRARKPMSSDPRFPAKTWIERLENEAALRKLMSAEERWRVICDTVNNLGLFDGLPERRKKRKQREFVF